jgi:hypothetical protein
MLRSIFIQIFLIFSVTVLSQTSDYITIIKAPTNTADCKNGSIDLIFNGSGYPPYDVEWVEPNGFTHSILSVSGNNVGEDISNLAPGQYQLTTTDARCGVAVETFTLTCLNCTQEITTVKLIHPTCKNDGSIDIQVLNNLSATIGYAWFKQQPNSTSWVQMYQGGGGPNGGDLGGLGAGTYRLEINDAGCKREKQFTLTSLANVDASIGIVKTVTECKPNPLAHASYYDSSRDGILCVNYQAGTQLPPHTVVWSDGFTGSCRYNLHAGVYSAKIVFGEGCEKKLDPVTLCCCANSTSFTSSQYKDIPFCYQSSTGNPVAATIKEAKVIFASSAVSTDGEIHITMDPPGVYDYRWSPAMPNSGDLVGLKRESIV